MIYSRTFTRNPYSAHPCGPGKSNGRFQRTRVASLAEGAPDTYNAPVQVGKDVPNQMALLHKHIYQLLEAQTKLGQEVASAFSKYRIGWTVWKSC